METRYFLELDGGIVKGSVMAARSDWATVNIPLAWVQVTADIYANTPKGSIQNADGTFTPPTPAPVVRRIRKYDFFRLLTPTEYGAMFNQSDPTLAYGVALFQSAPDPFNIDDPIVTQMLNYCVQVNALTQARKDELWAGMQAAAI
jgi:hypothetical protein